ncbi:MAG: hypothetical protein ACP5GL_02770 [Infirmifilum sp.]
MNKMRMNNLVNKHAGGAESIGIVRKLKLENEEFLTNEEGLPLSNKGDLMISAASAAMVSIARKLSEAFGESLSYIELHFEDGGRLLLVPQNNGIIKGYYLNNRGDYQKLHLGSDDDRN